MRINTATNRRTYPHCKIPHITHVYVNIWIQHTIPLAPIHDNWSFDEEIARYLVHIWWLSLFQSLLSTITFLVTNLCFTVFQSCLENRDNFCQVKVREIYFLRKSEKMLLNCRFFIYFLYKRLQHEKLFFNVLHCHNFSKKINLNLF